MSLFDKDILEKEHPEVVFIRNVKIIVDLTVSKNLRHGWATSNDIQRDITNEFHSHNMNHVCAWKWDKDHIIIPTTKPYTVADNKVAIVGWYKSFPVYQVTCVYNIDEKGTRECMYIYAGVEGLMSEEDMDFVL